MKIGVARDIPSGKISWRRFWAGIFYIRKCSVYLEIIYELINAKIIFLSHLEADFSLDKLGFFSTAYI